MQTIKKIVLFVTAALIIFILTASIVLTISMASIKLSIPQIKNEESNTEQDLTAKEITNYKEMVTILQAQKTNIYDFIVLRTLLPLFNSLIISALTYVFTKVALEGFKVYTAAKIKRS